MAAEIIIEDARIHTLTVPDEVVRAIAIGGGRILGVGDEKDIQEHVGRGTRVLSLEGRGVYPGFTDAHVHLLKGGHLLTQLDLRSVGSKDEFRRQVRATVRELAPGQWLLGRNWDHERVSSGTFPDRTWVDDLTPHNPVMLHRYDGHSVLVNSVALEKAGMTQDTPSPEGGEIHRDASGAPTGLLTDSAIYLMERYISEPTDEAHEEAARLAIRHANSWGLTEVHDMTQTPDRTALQRIHDSGDLTLRVFTHSYPGFRTDKSQISELRENLKAYLRLGVRQGFGDPMLKFGAIKVFTDGSLGSRTALMRNPYDDDPQSSGLERITSNDLRQFVVEAHHAGVQLAIHAIGDLANKRALDAIEAASRTEQEMSLRHRIEHAQIIDLPEVDRFQSLGVVASVQPSHLITDMAFTEKRVGSSRIGGAYAFKSLLEAGTILAFGTDWPIDELNPLKTIYAAVTRMNPETGQPWQGAECLSLFEALRAYTWGAAYAAFEEKQRGTIEVGKVADVTVLSRDLMDTEPEGYLETEVDLTIVAGQVVYERSL